MPKKMGRPKKEIDWDTFEKLCAIMCTLEEIANFFDCSVDTIERGCKLQYGCTFAEIYKKYSAAAKASLRRAQFTKALDGNVPLLIWLGKQYLGQTEKIEEKNETQHVVYNIGWADESDSERKSDQTNSASKAN